MAGKGCNFKGFNMYIGWVNGHFFRILEIKSFYIVVDIFDLVQDVQDVETVKGIFQLLTASENLFKNMSDAFEIVH